MPLVIELLHQEEIEALEEIFGHIWRPPRRVEPEGAEVFLEPADPEARFEFYRELMERPLS